MSGDFLSRTQLATDPTRITRLDQWSTGHETSDFSKHTLGITFKPKFQIDPLDGSGMAVVNIGSCDRLVLIASGGTTIFFIDGVSCFSLPLLLNSGLSDKPKLYRESLTFYERGKLAVEFC